MDLPPLNAIDICAGSGIGSWAFERIGFARTVCYVEYDPYCQRLLQARMRSGDLAPAPIWDDLKTFDGRPWRGCVDFVFGGVPCQSYSCAGKQLGADDPRDLWPDFRRVLGEIRPGLMLLENVAGFASHRDGLRRVLGDLAEDGWDAVWTIVSAADAGAPHLRKRVWILAYPGSAGRQQITGSAYGDEGPDEGRTSAEVYQLAGFSRGPRLEERRGVGGDPREEQQAAQRSGATDVADAAGNRQSRERRTRDGRQGFEDGGLPDWAGGTLAQPSPVTAFEVAETLRDVRGVPDGLAAGLERSGRDIEYEVTGDGYRVPVRDRGNRLRVLGNGWVPQAAVLALETLLGMAALRREPVRAEVTA